MTPTTGALVATLLVEVPVVCVFYPRSRTLPIAVAVNVVTNSLLNRVWFSVVPWWWVAFVSGEGMVVAIEAFVYRRWLGRDAERAITASLAANIASVAIGPLVYGWLG